MIAGVIKRKTNTDRDAETNTNIIPNGDILVDIDIAKELLLFCMWAYFPPQNTKASEEALHQTAKTIREI